MLSSVSKQPSRRTLGLEGCELCSDDSGGRQCPRAGPEEEGGHLCETSVSGPAGMRLGSEKTLIPQEPEPQNKPWRRGRTGLNCGASGSQEGVEGAGGGSSQGNHVTLSTTVRFNVEWFPSLQDAVIDIPKPLRNSGFTVISFINLPQTSLDYRLKGRSVNPWRGTDEALCPERSR